jgi:DNA-binding NarL/FixJ family response regulator
MTVLIADSSSAIRRRLIKLISKLNHIDDIIQASSVENTLHLQQQLKPEVLILAHDLPGGDILETVNRIHSTTAQARVIILTDIVHPKFNEKCLSAGATHIFDKSSEFGKILEVLN